ncbi:c-type cytochrome [Bryobacter aggregatus]|uniref:c-type cytochrome n=1 Tax=Bryobacter aggregatus TaxID=360054 RepID=UPI0004E10AFD|nr:hypothetical protein [Bryobacter aggregatus]
MNYKVTLLAAAVGSGLFLLAGQEPAPPAAFTSAQAEAGRAAYEKTCGQCHTPTLLGRKGEAGEVPLRSSLSPAYQKFIGPRGFVSPLAGKVFLDHWGASTAAQLIARFQEAVHVFPPDDKDPETAVNLTAYVLQVNGAKAGKQPLTRNTNAVVSALTR